MPHTLQKKWRAVCVWNRYSVRNSSPASRRNWVSCTFTIKAFLRRQIEQSHIVSSGKSVSISKRTAPQWQLPVYVCIGRALIASHPDLGLDELREQGEGFLPAEVAGFGWNDIRHALLHDAQLRSAGYRLQRDGDVHESRKIGIVESVGMADAPVRLELEILAAERVSVPRREIRERHLERAANPGLEMMHVAGEAVRRQPFAEGVGIEEGSVDAFGGRAQNAVQGDGVGHWATLEGIMDVILRRHVSERSFRTRVHPARGARPSIRRGSRRASV